MTTRHTVPYLHAPLDGAISRGSKMLDAQDFDFSGKTVLVTGAASGIGSAVAGIFAEHGATLRLADRNPDGLQSRAESLSTSDAQMRVYDQRSPDDLRALAKWASDADVLFNNAGIVAYGPSESLSDTDIQAVIETNLTGPILLANAIGRHMLARGSGVIINTTSQLAFCGAPERAVYASTKAGLAQFTRSVGSEWAGRGVRVAAIAPGRTLTPLNSARLSEPAVRQEALRGIPSGRFGEAEEIARLVLMLASDVAGYVVGHSLIADGGYVSLQ